MCAVSEGVQLANVTIGEIGSGMKRLNDRIRPILFSAERNVMNVDLGDLCATGDESSWNISSLTQFSDTIQINTTLKNTDLSQCECKLLMLDLHAGPWVTDGQLVDTNKINARLNKTDLRRMEIRVSSISSSAAWPDLVFDQFTQLIDQTQSETENCQVQTWTSAYLTTEAEALTTVRAPHIQQSPFNRRHINLMLGKASDVYYIRIHLTDTDEKWFSGLISITTDGRAFSDIGECTFIADVRNSYLCVFKNSFHARRLRIIPTKPVIKHKITQSFVQLYGIPFKEDVHQFVCFNGVYYKNKMVTVWTDGSGLQFQ
ncbi:hypothetical protein FGIG_10257 [Fasciola gigantica]|uniref:F5/8 type C domain-containing protein n=1 Tax=Fasciola gigantica TaxID=46835 RepID=A0A504Y6Y9_FASGI|nr:hypothetical protein FGIG_10257 [Fasciola gigantica]